MVKELDCIGKIIKLMTKLRCVHTVGTYYSVTKVYLHLKQEEFEDEK